MTTVAPSPAQVRAYVSALRKESNVFGIHSPTRWTGLEALTVGGEVARVRYCESPLEVREALLESDESGGPLVVLTPLTDRDLESDVRARLARRKILHIRSWDVLRDMLQLRGMDPRLDSEPWMADVLLEAAAGKPIPSGFLDADTAWDLVGSTLGLATGRPDALELLRWAGLEQGVDAFRTAPQVLKDGLRRRVAETAGAVGPLLLDSFDGPAGDDSIALGLASSVVFSADAPAEARITLERAAVRLERYCGNNPIPVRAGRAWANAAELIADDTVQQRGLNNMRTTLQHADTLLRELEAAEWAGLGRWSLLGFERRLGTFAAHLDRVLEGAAVTELAAPAAAVRAHGLAPQQRERVERIDMAARLVRWLRQVPTAQAPGSFEEAVRSYAADSGFADALRAALEAGDGCEPLSSAYGRLLQQVVELRERENETFARLLAGWSQSAGTLRTAIPVEQVLTTIVAPLADLEPVLLLVVDGMSQAVYREVAADIVREGWVELVPQAQPTFGPVVAAFPTVTEVSRASLFHGRLTSGLAAQEKSAFESHPELTRRSKKAPVLFHKADLGEVGEPGLSPAVRAEIADPDRQIVGLVINAIDDHLAKGDQIRPTWGVESIRPLRGVLHAAQQAGRVVVITSDHGHQPERGSELRAHKDGERWRSDDESAGPGETLITGPRVVAGQGRLIALWSERLRYGFRKNGYHGGASPQEVVIPLGVYSAGLPVEGWVEAATALPLWWSEELQVAPPPPVAARAPRKSASPKKQTELFNEGASQVQERWVDAMLASAAWKTQVQAAGRVAQELSRIRQALEALDERGGSLTRTALAARLQLPHVRVAGFVVALRRLLNVDGYDVLHLDEASDTVVLNRELLKKQFELP
jgi:hypothetical protein